MLLPLQTATAALAKYIPVFFTNTSQESTAKTAKSKSEPHTPLKEVRKSSSPKSSTYISKKFSDECTWGLTYQQDKKTLLLDLDNTLIYAAKEVPELADYTIVNFEKREDYLVRYVIKRPGLTKFLKKLSKVYNICVYTSATEIYARKIIEATGISKYIYTLYHRDHCEKLSNGFHLKNIWSLGFKPENALLVDDLITQTACQLENSVLIKPFRGDIDDRELYNLYPFFQLASSSDDIRVVQKNLAELRDSSPMLLRKKREQYDRLRNSDENDENIGFNEGSRRSCVRTLICHPMMMRTNYQPLVASVC